MKKMIYLFLFLLLFSRPALAEPDFNKLADAIYSAENSAKFPYGIKSVKCGGEADCRRVCLNTLSHKYRIWAAIGSRMSYLEFLASRYAPIGQSSLNRNWLKNVRFYLTHPKVIK